MPQRRNFPSDDGDDGGPAVHTVVMSYHRAGLKPGMHFWTLSRDILKKDSPRSFRQICNADDLLIRAATGKPHTNELRQFLNFHDDFNGSSLEQLTQWLTMLSLTIRVYLHSFSSCCSPNLRNRAKFQTHRPSSSRSSKVIDLDASRKRTCNSLLVPLDIYPPPVFEILTHFARK